MPNRPDLEALKVLLSKATGTPWQQKHEYEPDVIVGNVDGEIIDGATHYSYDTVAECMDNPDTDLPLIVGAVNAAPDLIAHIERLQNALREAREALCDYACHGGPGVPCIRTPEQCHSECGQSAGDAIVAIDKALSQGTSHE